tara:strand:- start:3110 stop:5683 length:2574 start_codon:yes stop_codon:yes gene_type:complete
MSKEFLIECSRNKAIETNTNNNSEWTNIVSNGLILNPNDQLSLHSAYINSIGVAEPDSVFLSGGKSGNKIYKNKYNTTNKLFDKTITYEQFDNKLTLLNSYFKNGDGNYMFFNPPTYWGNSEANYRVIGETVNDPDSDADSVLRPIQSTTFWDTDPPVFSTDNIIQDYIQRYKNQRYTIFKRDTTVNSTTNYFQKMVYYPYETEINIDLPKGYNNKAFIASEITRQLNTVINETTEFNNILNNILPVRKESVALGFRSPALNTDYLELKDGFKNLGITMFKETQVLKAIDCGTEQTYSRQAYSTFRQNTSLDLYKINFNYIGVLYPETFLAFRKFLYNPKQELGGAWSAGWGIKIGNVVNHITILEDLPAQVVETIVETSLEFNDANNKALFDVFEAQLYDYTVLTDFNLAPNVERFIHINSSESFTYTDLGSDFFFNHLAQVLKIRIDPNTYGIRGTGTTQNPDYGFAYKSTNGNISLKMTTPADGIIQYPINNGSRLIGCSLSATSWGNQSTTFYNGYNTEEASAKLNQYKITFGGVDYFTSPTIKKFYIGADQILFSYSETENRYEIKQCHMSKKLGNDLRVLEEPDFLVNPNAGQSIYKINPYDTETNNPTVVPNNPADVLVVDETVAGNTRPFFSLQRYTVFDSYSGIFWDFSIDTSFYKKSLWYILGFTENIIFNQSPTRSTIQLINTYGQNSFPLTTNALINSDDMINFSVNPQSYPSFIGQLPIIQFSTAPNQPETNRPENITQIILNQNSTSITADKITINNQEGIYLVRSNIIPNMNYLDGEINNIVGVIDKSYLVNDFIYSKESDLIFTISKKCSINNIKIDIKNADGTEAILDENSVIIFKITKT